MKKTILFTVSLLCSCLMLAQSGGGSTTITIGPGLHSTYFNSQKAYKMPEGCVGVFVYLQEIGYEDEREYEWQRAEAYESGEKVPAGEALIIYSPTPGTYELEFDQGTEKAYPAGRDLNLLSGTDVDYDLSQQTDAADNYYYALSYDKTGTYMGIYWMTEGGGPFTNKAHKVYLKAPKDKVGKLSQSPTGSKQTSGFSFEEINVTGIGQVMASMGQGSPMRPVFDLSGRKVSGHPAKGIYVRNGKKYIVR